ncbi:hypothetical protein CVIRNUC_003114 [Coccomyxa viridis]|uniref:Secreted protein n=1 Tax=Coccomyxa viridis TaxID=1274662 RepID=A0AAV1HXM1_9CHLO|nr:hypothetical protein CVIRNUC_003114 [Coccomyxa viridis]
MTSNVTLLVLGRAWAIVLTACEALDRIIACITGLDQGKYEMYTQHAEETDKMSLRRGRGSRSPEVLLPSWTKASPRQAISLQPHDMNASMSASKAARR